MTLKDALDSGNRFRRAGSTAWFDPDILGSFTRFDVIAVDWEVEEERILLSASEVSHVLSNAFAVHVPDRTRHEVLLKLGFSGSTPKGDK
jgi:hypothetical protein